MEGSAAKKSTSLETLVIQTISNVNDLKAKLNEIIKTGKDYEFDVSSCIKSLLNNSDQEIVLLSVQAISELAKCDEKRETFAQEDIIKPIMKILEKEATPDKLELIKQSCRALGNLCCDCDTARKIIMDCKGVSILKNVLDHSFFKYNEITKLTCKTLLNFSIGGLEFSELIVEENILDLLHKLLRSELEKEDPDDDMISTVLLIMSVINDNSPEFLFSEEINLDILRVLRDTTNMEVSELCLDHLHVQAEHDSVKNLLAREGGVELVCARLEELVSRREAGALGAAAERADAVVKRAGDLVVLVLTGDEAMGALYAAGAGAAYGAAARWLRARRPALLPAAVLALGNFARGERHCRRMLAAGVYDQLLDVLEEYQEPESGSGSDGSDAEWTETAARVRHGAAAALRNLAVPADNKRAAAAAGAAPRLARALAAERRAPAAGKLLAALRMLVDGQESVAETLMESEAALAAAARWGLAGECAGAAGEAPRLLAWSARALRRSPRRRPLVRVEGCLACLVNMLLASHSLMQNEAILALTLLAIESLKKPDLSPDTETTDFDYEQSFTTQLIKSEIGKHITVLVDTNCAKMPIEVAENLVAFLDITSKKNEIATDYKQEKVHESLKKFAESRSDLSADMNACLQGIISAISDRD